MYYYTLEKQKKEEYLKYLQTYQNYLQELLNIEEGKLELGYSTYLEGEQIRQQLKDNQVEIENVKEQQSLNGEHIEVYVTADVPYQKKTQLPPEHDLARLPRRLVLVRRRREECDEGLRVRQAGGRGRCDLPCAASAGADFRRGGQSADSCCGRGLGVNRVPPHGAAIVQFDAARRSSRAARRFARQVVSHVHHVELVDAADRLCCACGRRRWRHVEDLRAVRRLRRRRGARRVLQPPGDIRPRDA